MLDYLEYGFAGELKDTAENSERAVAGVVSYLRTILGLPQVDYD